MMKHIITLLVALFLVASIANSAEKRCLLEQHTGAWCGWCPDGTVIMDELMTANPGKVIGIKYHHTSGGDIRTDKMELPDGAIMFQAFSGTGFPSGSVDRTVWDAGGGKTIIMLDRSYWKETTNIVLSGAAAVDVTLTWSYNDATKQISGTVNCAVLQDVNYQLAFQVVVCEDNVTGTGDGFDQHNYFSGNATYVGHPYYDKPAIITGYVHNKVARAVIGGVAGNPSTFPAVVKAGESYKWDFVSDVPGVPAGSPVKMDDVYLVGVVGVSQQGYVIPVLNCVESRGGGAGNTLKVDGDSINYAGSNQQATFKFYLDNTLDVDKTYNLSIVKETTSPDDWLAQVVGGKNSVTVTKSTKATISIDVSPGETIGNGLYTLVATDASDAGIKLEAQVEVVHTDAERLYIYSPLEDYDGLNALIPQTGFDKFSSLSITKIGGDFTKIQAALAKFTKVKTAIISCADKFSLSATDIKLIQNYNTAGVDILLAGSISLMSPDIQTYLNTTFGFGATKQFKIANNDNEMPIEGIAGDIITNGFSASLIPDKYWPTSFNITDAAKAKKILVYTDNKTDIAGIRCDNNGTKLVALGFAIGNVFDDQQKLELLENSLNWLESATQELPAITVDKEAVDFGSTQVELTTEKSITVTNQGTADLIIDGINITGTDASAFTFESITVPKTITPNGTLVINAIFAPTTEKSYSAILNILSNDESKPEVSVNLAGSGIANAVETEAGSICSISLSPNPVTTYSHVTYKVTGSVNATIRINDAQGKVVAEIYNGILNEGTYNYSLNTSNLSSGNYFITAQFDSKWETVPFVIVK